MSGKPSPLEAHRNLLESERGYVFLVSHMRSYSSLLAHLLAETGEVDGYSELHRSYDSDLDLVRMVIDVQNTYDHPLAGRLLFDKILHRALRIAPSIIERSDTRVILSVRSPAASISSLLELGRRDDSVRWAKKPDGALRHYTRRLEDIEAIATAHPDCGFLIADDLLERPADTLASIATFLSLTQPISTDYSMQRFTGAQKFGDTSDQIRSGVLQPRTSPPGRLKAKVLATAQAAFDKLLASEAVAATTHLTPLDTYR